MTALTTGRLGRALRRADSYLLWAFNADTALSRRPLRHAGAGSVAPR